MLDIFTDPEVLTYWLTNYGSISIFILLVLGIVALPVPEETLLVLTGVLMCDGKLPITATMFAAYAGSICGISTSYLLGRTVGIYFMHKYGRWVGITEQKIMKVHDWFEHYGKWSLTIGYFIPGVRHFTGFIAGTTYLELHHFALFAYSGALLWVSTFLSIGYFFGRYWSELFERIEISADWIAIALVLAFVSYVIYRFKKQPPKE